MASIDLPWKVTVTRSVSSWRGNNAPNAKQHYFVRDTKYKSYIRWEHKLSNVSNIINLRVERSKEFSLSPNDSYTVVLKIRGIQEKEMGTIDVITPTIEYNPKPWLGNIKKNDIYVKVYLYEKASGKSSTNCYQAAADNYNIFMSELREIWRKQLIDAIINDKIINQQKINENEELSNSQMYDLCKKLHKRCKSKEVWNDLETAFNQSFGAMNHDDIMDNNKNNKNNKNNNNNNWNFGGNANNNNNNNNFGNFGNNNNWGNFGRFQPQTQPQSQPQSQTQTQTPQQPTNRYNLRSRR